MNIPDEAVEAAAKALYEVYPSLAIPGDESSAVPWESAHHARQYEDRKQARAALESAAPYMLSMAWEQGELAGALNHSLEEYPHLYHELAKNPYRPTDAV